MADIVPIKPGITPASARDHAPGMTDRDRRQIGLGLMGCVTLSKKGPSANFWTPPPVQESVLAWEVGEIIGAKAVAFMRNLEADPSQVGESKLLVYLLRDMVRRGEYGGTEQGFAQVIANAVIYGR